MLRPLTRTLALGACLLAGFPARAEAADTDSDLPPPSASEAGWFGLSVGLGAPMVETAQGSHEPSDVVEGKAGSDGNYRLSYEKQLLGPLGLRGFASSTDWGTELSEASGDGDRTLYDLGGGPVLSYATSEGRYGVSLFAVVPISFSWSSAPALAKREIVRETMDVGTGYRIGIGVGMLARLSPRLAMLVELEATRQQVSHVRRYRRFDGTGKDEELPIRYELSWAGIQVGLALFP